VTADEPESTDQPASLDVSGHGGNRGGSGRKPLFAEPLVKKTVTLPAIDVSLWESLGHGNLSAAMRAAARVVRDLQPAAEQVQIILQAQRLVEEALAPAREALHQQQQLIARAAIPLGAERLAEEAVAPLREMSRRGAESIRQTELALAPLREAAQRQAELMQRVRPALEMQRHSALPGQRMESLRVTPVLPSSQLEAAPAEEVRALRSEIAALRRELGAMRAAAHPTGEGGQPPK